MVVVEQLSSRSNAFSVEDAQQRIYNFFLDIVRCYPADQVLLELKYLFFQFVDSSYPISNPGVLQSLYAIIDAGNEKEFRYTLRRCCYILINNWSINNQAQSTRNLVSLFTETQATRKIKTAKLRTLKAWLENFVKSEDYQNLKLFASKQGDSEGSQWCDRYSSYILTSQYSDISNSLEQRQIAEVLSRKIKTKFKFDLAMYTARARPRLTGSQNLPQNPTNLGDEVLYLIKVILTRQGEANYKVIANDFLDQNRNVKYLDFKLNLLSYLSFNYDDKDVKQTFEDCLLDKIKDLLPKYNSQKVSASLLLCVCNRAISYLTVDENKHPSQLFNLLLSQGNPLVLVILFLKLILICEDSRPYLETCIAELIKYYSYYPEDECYTFINFLDILNVTFAIYARDARYNLVKMSGTNPQDANFSYLGNYRIFSQVSSQQLE